MYGAHLGSRLSDKVLGICTFNSHTDHTIRAKMAPLRIEQPGDLSWVHCLTEARMLITILSPTHHSPSKYSDRQLIRAGKVMSHLVGRSASQASLSLAFLGGLTRYATSNRTFALE